ncbi:hypothetical protein DSO57_1030753 [Entomophthora muscae]|uniref:Uncharacterized protein n=1 Tax=Entomophthora muscae TaxID=34485 RepID=A0ACC2SE86_9FUNG|nr:hypothetical protein DSO57_1030753 [Entomophthora muscae]
MACQARSASHAGVQPESGMGCNTLSSIWFVKPAYMTEEEFEQLKQSALVASSQSTNPAFSTHPSRLSRLPSNPDPQAIT